MIDNPQWDEDDTQPYVYAPPADEPVSAFPFDVMRRAVFVQLPPLPKARPQTARRRVARWLRRLAWRLDGAA